MTATTERQTPVVPARLSRPINWLMEEVPARRLEVVRVITVLYCVVWIAIRTDHWRHLAELPESRWRPVGLAGWLGGRPSSATVTVIAVVAFGVGVYALWGRRWAVVGPLFAVGFRWLTTFAASWGQILHTEHLPSRRARPDGRAVPVPPLRPRLRLDAPGRAPPDGHPRRPPPVNPEVDLILPAVAGQPAAG